MWCGFTGQENKSTWDGTMMASIHVGALAAAGSRWPIGTNFAHFNPATLKLQTKNRH